MESVSAKNNRVTLFTGESMYAQNDDSVYIYIYTYI